MAAIPAETSRPTRRVSDGDFGDPIIAVVVLAALILGLYVVSKGILTLAALMSGGTDGGMMGWLLGIVYAVGIEIHT
jgi:hypothetical protein